MGYELVKLKDICMINPKLDRKLIDETEIVSFVPMASVSDIKKKIVLEEERVAKDVLKGFTYFENGDVILAKITPCYENGKIALVDIKNKFGFGSTEFHVLRSNEKKICPKYLYFMLQVKYFFKLGKMNMTGSGGQKRLPKKFLENFEIPLPPMDIQIKIANALDKAQELINDRKAQTEKYDELLQSVFLDMFGDPVTNPKGWEVKSLKETTNFIDYRGKTPIKSKIGIKLVTAKNIRMGFYKNNPEEFVSENNYEKIMTRGFVNANDVIFTTEGATLGFTARIPRAYKKFAMGQRMIALQPMNKLTSEYLQYYMCSKKFQNDVLKRSTGSTAKGIRSKELEKITLPIPNLELQNQFAEIVEKVENEKKKMENSLEELENNFNSIMQKAFKGELF